MICRVYLSLVIVAATVCIALAPLRAAEEPSGMGTGFVVSPNGYLLTCAHVVKDVAAVKVMVGAKTWDAAVLSVDEKSDLALLQVPAKDLAALPLGNSNAVEVGQEVRVFGYPLASMLGEDLKVTRGTVAGISMREAQKVFQIDAAVNPGNSGGPLVNEKGEVVGVVNAKLAGLAVTAVGFAVPINYAKPLLRDEGVEFATEGAKEKLDGPALVKLVSPSVALISVWEKKGGAAVTPTPPVEVPKPPVSPEAEREMKEAQQAALQALAGKGVQSPEGMVLVPPGEFTLGAADGNANEKPERKVALSAFWVDKAEVTNEQFVRFVSATGYHPEGGWKWEVGMAAYPAVNLTWNDAAAYAKWAGKRLPTEAEWEKAARGTDARRYPWGNELAAEKANLARLADGFDELSAAGTLKDGAAVWGALDMCGNVWEWCADDYVPYDAPTGRGLSKVIRGGSFASSPTAGRCTARAALLPTVALSEVGFRCAKDEPNLLVVSGVEPPAVATATPAVVPTVWEGEVQFAREETVLKCSPAFDRITFETPLGTLTVPRDYILSVSGKELSLLGGSTLKGTLQEASLPVTWSLGKREIAMKDATYRRVAPPPVISMGVNKDGGIVAPSFTAQAQLADESLLVGNLRETSLRLRVAGVETDVPVEKIVQLFRENGRLQIVLQDGNVLPAELAGDCHFELLEGPLTLTARATLAALTFARKGVSGFITRINPKDGAEMVYVPAGEFLMGSKEGEGESDERPQHTVYLDSYWIYKTEVTVAQYRKFCQATGRGMPSEPSWKWQDDHPIVNVSWNDGVAYAKWAGAALPMEAQWEKAARGTDGREYPWGTDWDGEKCQNSVGSKSAGKTAAVGSFPAGASPYGALDMAGNVWEWCADWYEEQYYKNSPARNPTGPTTGTRRVLRGGSWNSYLPDNFRAACRNNNNPMTWVGYWGFRCALRSPGQ